MLGGIYVSWLRGRPQKWQIGPSQLYLFLGWGLLIVVREAGNHLIRIVYTCCYRIAYHSFLFPAVFSPAAGAVLTQIIVFDLRASR